MNDPQLWLLVHMAATNYMTGVIWFVQLVQYPLFSRVGKNEFIPFAKEHTGRTTWVVAPAMLLELTLVLWLAWTRPGLLTMSGLALLVVAWISTWAWQVPMHRRLASGFDAAAHRRLVRGNWVRTIAWTMRSVVALMLLHPHV
ncbi:MAG TPA: hypothetical protein DCY13_03565 [Verrucomicrobiales bacterium]|nr:hypothetical protein [Verrucomicrobiales bacterium]